MSARHHAAGEGPDRSSLSVRCPDVRRRDQPAVNHDGPRNVDTLAGQTCDSLDERCETAGAKSRPEISALACLLEFHRHRWADKHQIPDLHRSMKRLDPPEAEGLARGQVQPVTAADGDRRDTSNDRGRGTDDCQCRTPGQCFSVGVWRCDRRRSSTCFNVAAVRSWAASCCAVRITGQAS